MKGQSTVTRGSQITLTKEVREKANIREGDRVIVNVQGGVVMISKRNSKVFDEIEGFLPENFGHVLKKMRTDEKERLVRLGITK